LLDRWNERLKSHPLAVAALLALVVFAVYSTVLGYGFVYDDVEQVLQNPFVLNPRLWVKNLTTSVWAFQGIHSSFYRPLQFLVYWLLCRVAGPSPGVFHFVQLVAYAGTAWLVYRLGRELCGNEAAALVGAVLWVLHPQHVEAVAWISALPDVGCGFFYLLAFFIFLRAEKAAQPRAAQHAWAALALLAALLFKEAAISFPVMLVAFWFFEERAEGIWRRIVRLLPYAIVIGVYLVVRESVLGFLTDKPLRLEGSLRTLGGSVGLLGEHARLFFWPSGLTAFRTFDLTSSLRSPWPWVTLLVLLAAVVLRRRERVLGFLLIWWLVALLPCLDFRMLSSPLVADRFSYIPSVGPCLGLAFLLLVRLPVYVPNWRPVRLAVPALALLMGYWTIQTVRTIPHWSGDEVLVEDGMRKFPDSQFLHLARATVLQYRDNDLDAAAREYETAIELNRRSIKPVSGVVTEALLGLGHIAQIRGRTEEAVAYYERAIRASRVNGAAYDALGAVYFPRRDYARAAEYFSQALKANPYDLGARFYLGACWMKLGRPREAAEQFRAAREVDPTYWQAFEAEAGALEAAGDVEAAAQVRRLAPRQ
jgi:Tfp pilus assembly protein PilF